MRRLDFCVTLKGIYFSMLNRLKPLIPLILGGFVPENDVVSNFLRQSDDKRKDHFAEIAVNCGTMALLLGARKLVNKWSRICHEFHGLTVLDQKKNFSRRGSSVKDLTFLISQQ